MEEEFGDKLQAMTTGCRLEVRCFGVSKQVSKEQRQQIADLFESDAKSVKGSRGVFDRSHELFKPLFSALSEARALWRGNTIKYEDGIRLLRTDRIEWMTESIGLLQEQVNAAVASIAANWESVKADARKRLVNLYVEEDYDFDARMEVGVMLSFPELGPDNRLKLLHPELYKAELKKLKQRFDDVAIANEIELAKALQGMLAHLSERLTESEEGGKKKVIKTAVLDNIVEFATQFKALSIGSIADLDKVVEDARDLANNVDPQLLRKGIGKESVKKQISDLKAQVDKMLEDAPLRAFDL